METAQDDRVERPRSQSHGVRKRTRRACDRCSGLRVRCDGHHPCRRCEEYGQTCHYARSIGKRGRKPRVRRPQDLPVDDTQYGDSPEGDHELEDKPHTQLQLTPNPTQQPRFYPPVTTDSGSPYVLIKPAETEGPSPPRQMLAPTLEVDQPVASVLSQTASQDHEIDHRGGSLSLPSDVANSPGLSQARRLSPFSHTQIQHPVPSEAHQSAPSLNISPQDEQPSRHLRCLEPILPALHGIVDTDLACELLELYFVEPGGSLFRCASPYVLTRVLRKESLLRPDNPRRTTPALLATMLWVSAQTADSSLFLLPGQKARVCEGLRELMLALVQDRDRDSWHRTTTGLLLKDCDRAVPAGFGGFHSLPRSSSEPPPVPSTDDVLAFVLLTIVTSGGDFKNDCLRWWTKTLRLSRAMGLNREDGPLGSTPAATCTKGTNCACRACDAARAGISVTEAQEERRRVFWLIFCLDRHLALSYNSSLSILDDECELYCPLTDSAWDDMSFPMNIDPSMANRTYGPPTTVSGTGFFEYFLPLMTILGDVIQVHRRKCHPRFGGSRLDEENDGTIALVEGVMADCARSIADMAFRYEVNALDGAVVPASQAMTPTSTVSHDGLVGPPSAPSPIVPGASNNGSVVDTSGAQPQHAPGPAPRGRTKRNHAQAQLVTAYSSFILHVLHVLLHGKWDAVSMLENKDGWTSSVGFMKCASHSIAASDAVSRILACDPELTFMPYLFGIYLLHGSFILLLFADRMPQIGLNESVERACEIIIRAHEVCVVTLNTEFQKQFRKVLRSTLYSVRSAGVSNIEESKSRRRALSLYRWSSGFTGLAL